MFLLLLCIQPFRFLAAFSTMQHAEHAFKMWHQSQFPGAKYTSYRGDGTTTSSFTHVCGHTAERCKFRRPADFKKSCDTAISLWPSAHDYAQLVWNSQDLQGRSYCPFLVGVKKMSYKMVSFPCRYAILRSFLLTQTCLSPFSTVLETFLENRSAPFSVH